ncbi:dihydrodipicolinate synthase family protein [Oceanobacillus sojae]|uniref:dihydrodipicolinate synthase family protein n=1 Tax=Oceanobacillus sojae TaxID=582851 RepID=UPI0009887AC8|nr:dihydrodipicolinate synthase family protein [Oceanobacillus sojae]
MSHKDFHGIIPYLISPIDQDTGKVKYDVLTALTKDLIDKGVHGLSPLGSTGEVHYLSWEQKIEVVQTVIDAAQGQVPVIPGVSAYTTNDAIHQIKHFEKMGVDGVVLILNTYFKLSKSEIHDFFRTIAKAASCPIVLYNNPNFSGVDLTSEIVINLASEPNIKYFKDATGNTGRLLTIMNKVGDNLKIFSASAHIPYSVLEMGGVGWMAGPACIFPKESIYLYDLICSKKWEEALEVQRELWKVNEIFQKYGLAACVKAALEIQGYDVGEPILPLKPLMEDEKSVIRNVITQLKIN